MFRHPSFFQRGDFMILLQYTDDGSVCPWEYHESADDGIQVGEPMEAGDEGMTLSVAPTFISASDTPHVDSAGIETYPMVRINSHQVWSGPCEEVAEGDSVGVEGNGFVAGGNVGTVIKYDDDQGIAYVVFHPDTYDDDEAEEGLVDYMVLEA